MRHYGRIRWNWAHCHCEKHAKPQWRWTLKFVDFSQLWYVNNISHILKGHWTSVTSSPNFFSKKLRFFYQKMCWHYVMTTCWFWNSNSAYFLRNIDICSNFYFLKSTSINTQYSGLWDTLEMMLFTKNQIKWKRIGRIVWNFWYWFIL